MAVEKVTPMVIKADLQCPYCYKKIKKTLCKFPQIRDQVFNQKANMVAVTVVCCSPEKIRDELCSKGGKVIRSIEIIELAKPPKPTVVVTEKRQEHENAEKPKSNGKVDNPKGDGAPPAEKPKKEAQPARNAEAAKALEPVPANGVPSVFPYCGPTYDAHAAGPYYHGYGFPPPPPQPCYEGYYGHTHGHAHGYGNGYGYGYGRGGNVTGCDAYFSEENPQACFIM